MALDISVQPQPCGALVRGIDLTRPLSQVQAAEVRAAWLQHQVLGFPDQPMSVDDLERFAQAIGPFGPDPYFESIPGHPHVAQVRREPDETTTIFADNWHSDWSFLANPPAATLLFRRSVATRCSPTSTTRGMRCRRR
jgi:taurine dioxygenase